MLTEMTTLYEQLTQKDTELTTVEAGIDEDYTNREKDLHNDEHALADAQHEFEFYQSKLQVKIDAHEEVDSQVRKLQNDIKDDEEELHYMDEYEKELDELIAATFTDLKQKQ